MGWERRLRSLANMEIGWMVRHNRFPLGRLIFFYSTYQLTTLCSTVECTCFIGALETDRDAQFSTEIEMKP